MANLRDLDPGWYSKSPIVTIKVLWHEEGEPRDAKFYVHEDLLLEKSQSKLFTRVLIEGGQDNIPGLCTVHCTPMYFKPFVRWLYIGTVDRDRDDILWRLGELWRLACQIESSTFKNYLVDLCEDYVVATAYIQQLGLLAVEQNPDPRLLEFTIEKLAFTICIAGWREFNAETDHRWKDLMRTLDEDGTQEAIMAKFKTKFAQFKAAIPGDVDPGRSLCKFHEHVLEDDKNQCQASRRQRMDRRRRLRAGAAAMGQTYCIGDSDEG